MWVLLPFLCFRCRIRDTVREITQGHSGSEWQSGDKTQWCSQPLHRTASCLPLWPVIRDVLKTCAEKDLRLYPSSGKNTLIKPEESPQGLGPYWLWWCHSPTRTWSEGGVAHGASPGQPVRLCQISTVSKPSRYRFRHWADVQRWENNCNLADASSVWTVMPAAGLGEPLTQKTYLQRPSPTFLSSFSLLGNSSKHPHPTYSFSPPPSIKVSYASQAPSPKGRHL